MKAIWRMFWAGLASILSGSVAGQATSQPLEVLKAKDIAIILPATGNLRIVPDDVNFPNAWWQNLAAAFARTSVGDAIERENQRDDWRLVAMRFAPCQPLLPFLTQRNEVLCRPELRLVWQPVQSVYRGNRWHYYADDRAIHALYRFEPQTLLSPDAAAQWRDLGAHAASLTATQIAQYRPLQRRLVQAIGKELMALRRFSNLDAYDDVGERPEFLTPGDAAQFMSGLAKFIQKYARPEHLLQLTAFSLPEGRDPPQLDEWVFIAFEPAASGLQLNPQALSVRSRRDGRLLAEYGESAQVSVRRDEPVLINLMDQAAGADHIELQEAVIWTTRERKLKAADIADPRRTHVAHTSCASCHKLGNPPFDFHNLSYFEDREISISPRVLKDVEYELEWLQRQ